jgi:excisionase family DNA binding protein
MKSRPTQFGMRENTASSRQHASLLSASPSKLQYDSPPRDSSPGEQCSLSRSLALEENDHFITKPLAPATGGEEREKEQLLTVQEVAELLHVPVSWVYGRMRKRSPEQLPGYRLGKYWRFREDEIVAWVRSQRGTFHAP